MLSKQTCAQENKESEMGEILMINCFLQKLLQKIKVFIPILKLNRIILDSYKTV